LLLPSPPVRQHSPVETGYRLVRLRNGACSVRALAEDETFHPGIGPAAEAEALYVRQLRLPERVGENRDEFVIWDVGLGAAANALTAIRLITESLNGKPVRIRLVSFDQTNAAAVFALEHVSELSYLAGFGKPLKELVEKHSVKFKADSLEVEWSLVLGDFPAWLGQFHGRDALPRVPADQQVGPTGLSAPHAILFDPHSPKKNPAMWTVPLFIGLFGRLDPQRPCALATFTRSTMARVALLLGGFFAGVGHPSGLKEETTVAANRLDLLDEPLDRRWLERAKRSGSAEPLREPVYRQGPLSPVTLAQLQQHPQFCRRNAVA
jgi:tRNA U34 5-methylaminomethyl-2-thiouridine-forming methyltransferase MnmC